LLGLVIRKARRFASQPAFTLGWSIPIYLLLGVARAIVLVVPFRKLAPVLGWDGGIAPWSPVLTDPQQDRALQIGRAIRTMAPYTPWESNCFAQALTARLLLSLYRIPYVLYFGLKRASAAAEMEAHAWVSAGAVSVTGGYSFGEYTTVAIYVSRQVNQPPSLPRG